MGAEDDKTDLVGRPSFELDVGRLGAVLASLDEQVEDFLDGIEARDWLAVPVEVARAHALADVDHHDDGDALGGDARLEVGPARASGGDDEAQQGEEAQGGAAPERDT